jgi:hypothetical protein
MDILYGQICDGMSSVACTINVLRLLCAIYNHNDSSQYYKTTIVVKASLILP